MKQNSNENRLIKSAFWSFAGILGRQITVFTIGVILARLLNPEQFGMIAMITVISNLGFVFLRFGFGSAIIQNTTIKQEDLSTVFFFNILIGFILGSLIYLGSYKISLFYNEPKLISLSKALSVIFLINAISIVPRSLLFKEVKLKIESIIIIISSILSGSLAIYLAVIGYGVWALAFKVIIQSSIESILLILFCGWKPNFIFDFSSLKKLLPFGSRMFASSLLYTLTVDIDKLIIGKLFNTTQLGFYDRSKGFNSLILDNAIGALAKVMFPAFSQIQNENDRFIETYKKAFRGVAIITIPLFLGLSLISKPLIIFLLTDKWSQAAILLKIMAISGPPILLSVIIGNAIAARGRADISLRIDIIKATLSIVSIFFGSRWGIEGVAVAVAISSFLGFFLGMYFAQSLLKIDIFETLKDLFIPATNSLLMILFLVTITKVIVMNNLQKILVLPSIGIIFYVAINYFLNKKQFYEFKYNIIELFKKRSYPNKL